MRKPRCCIAWCPRDAAARYGDSNLHTMIPACQKHTDSMLDGADEGYWPEPYALEWIYAAA